MGLRFLGGARSSQEVGPSVAARGYSFDLDSDRTGVRFHPPGHTVTVLLDEPLPPSDKEMIASKWVPSRVAFVLTLFVLPRATASSGRDLQFFVTEGQFGCDA